MIKLSKWSLVMLAALFSAYHVFLGLYSLGRYQHMSPAIVALVLYVVATGVSLMRPGRVGMSITVAAFDLAVCVAMPILVTTQLDPTQDNGYATWYVAAVGTLLTIVTVRRQKAFAWSGIGFLVLQTVAWAGVPALASLGVIGSLVWVAAAAVSTRALARASRDAYRFARAERQVAEWHAEQDAHLFERERRLEATYRRAEPLLSEIVRTGGELSEEARQECRLLESAMRDEIRGRALLNDAVRESVMAARRRGLTVQLLDDGGLDDMDSASRGRVRDRVAAALADIVADTVIVRTVQHASPVAVTVVGLSAADEQAAALGLSDDEDDSVALWLEIPRAS